MRLSDHCFAVTGLGYTPPWSVNAGFIVGGDATLIVDTGANAAAALTIHGYAQAAGPNRQMRVVNTEKHFDHIGGNQCFRNIGAEIWGHAAIARTGEEFAAEIREFNTAIPNPVRRARQESLVFFHETSAVNPSHPIAEELVMQLGDCRVEVLFTPGHTKTNISLWVPSDGVLYCGDCLVHLYLANLDASEPVDWPVWLQSIERIRGLGAATIVCGHGPVAKGDQVESIIDRVANELNDAIARGSSPTAAGS